MKKAFFSAVEFSKVFERDRVRRRVIAERRKPVDRPIVVVVKKKFHHI